MNLSWLHAQALEPTCRPGYLATTKDVIHTVRDEYSANDNAKPKHG
jgi:hypothetical protein